MGRTAFRIYFICFPLVGGQIIITNYFQAIGKPKLSIFLSLTRQLVFLIPFLIFLPRIWGVKGVWGSLTLSDFVAFIFAIVTLWFELRRQDKRFSNQIAE